MSKYGSNVNLGLNRELDKFSVNLKLYRMNEKLSQMDLADQLGVSHRTYQRIESGQAEANLSVLMKLSVIFKVSMSELVHCLDPNFSFELLKDPKRHENKIIQDFYGFSREHLTFGFEKLDEEPILSFIKKEDFQNSKLPLVVCNFSEFYVNQTLSGMFPCSLKKEARHTAVQTFDDGKDVISISSFLHGVDQVFYIHSSVHQFGASRYLVKSCGFYRFHNFKHLLCQCVLETCLVR